MRDAPPVISTTFGTMLLFELFLALTHRLTKGLNPTLVPQFRQGLVQDLLHERLTWDKVNLFVDRLETACK